MGLIMADKRFVDHRPLIGRWSSVFFELLIIDLFWTIDHRSFSNCWSSALFDLLINCCRGIDDHVVVVFINVPYIIVDQLGIHIPLITGINEVVDQRAQLGCWSTADKWPLINNFIDPRLFIGRWSTVCLRVAVYLHAPSYRDVRTRLKNDKGQRPKLALMKKNATKREKTT